MAVVIEAKTATEIVLVARLMGLSKVMIDRARFVKEHGTPEEITAVEIGNITVRGAQRRIRLRQRDGKPYKPPGRGGAHDMRIRIPPGTTVEGLCRDGLQLEAQGLNVNQAAAKLNVGKSSYRWMREIVILNDRAANLSTADRTIVQTAFVELTNPDALNLKKIYERVAPIAAKIWGNTRIVRDNRRIEERLEAFAMALDRVAETCASINQIPVPYLSKALAVEKIKLLKKADRDLGIMMQTLKEFIRDPT
jgi:hypothetical protein